MHRSHVGKILAFILSRRFCKLKARTASRLRPIARDTFPTVFCPPVWILYRTDLFCILVCYRTIAYLGLDPSRLSSLPLKPSSQLPLISMRAQPLLLLLAAACLAFTPAAAQDEAQPADVADPAADSAADVAPVDTEAEAQPSVVETIQQEAAEAVDSVQAEASQAVSDAIEDVQQNVQDTVDEVNQDLEPITGVSTDSSVTEAPGLDADPDADADADAEGGVRQLTEEAAERELQYGAGGVPFKHVDSYHTYGVAYQPANYYPAAGPPAGAPHDHYKEGGYPAAGPPAPVGQVIVTCDPKKWKKRCFPPCFGGENNNTTEDKAA